MRSFVAGLVGMLVGTVVVGSLGTAAVALVALGGTLIYVNMDSLELSEEAAPTRVVRKKRAPAASKTGQVYIQTIAAVGIHVDGAPLQFDGVAGYTTSLEPGEHLLQAFNAWGKEVAREKVVIRPGKRLMMKYANKHKSFAKTGEVTASVAPAPRAAVPAAVRAPAPAPAPVTPAPSAPNLGFLSGIRVGGEAENSETHTTSSSSSRSGEIRQPGRTDRYEDKAAESRQTKKRKLFRF